MAIIEMNVIDYATVTFEVPDDEAATIVEGVRNGTKDPLELEVIDWQTNDTEPVLDTARAYSTINNDWEEINEH
jgi:hypothetical protein